MRVEKVDSRVLRFTDLPQTLHNSLPSLEVALMYTTGPSEGPGILTKALALDDAAIPGIIEAVNSSAPEDNTFILKISLGNEVMMKPRHVAEKLREIADRLDARQEEGYVLDTNGNTVGRFRYHLDG